MCKVEQRARFLDLSLINLAVRRNIMGFGYSDPITQLNIRGNKFRTCLLQPTSVGWDMQV